MGTVFVVAWVLLSAFTNTIAVVSSLRGEDKGLLNRVFLTSMFVLTAYSVMFILSKIFQ